MPPSPKPSRTPREPGLSADAGAGQNADRVAPLLLLLLVLLIPVTLPAHASLPFKGNHHADTPPARPGYLGVVLGELDSTQAAQLHFASLPPLKKGSHLVAVLSVDHDAPAAAAGLRPQDILLAIGTKRVETLQDVRHELKRSTAGSTILLRLNRAGTEQTLAICLGDEDEIARRAQQRLADTSTFDLAAGTPTPAPPPPPGSASPHGLSFLPSFSSSATFTGIDLDPLSAQLAEYFGVHQGAGLLVRTVSDGSPGALAGIHAGDIILSVNNQPVVSRMDWLKQLHANRGRSVQISIVRNHHEQIVILTPGSGTKG